MTYTEDLERIAVAGSLLADIDINLLLAALERAETVGPIMEPTAWIRGGAQSVEDQRTLLEGFIPFWRAIHQLRARHDPKLS